MDASIVIPVFNQSQYTKRCLETLQEAGIARSQIVVVDNASTDDTIACLAAHPGVNVIRNENNRGCGGAWNQGVRALTATWTVVLNNDVIIPPGWLEGLVGFAEDEKVDVVSPASCEGETDYDVPDHARQFVKKMASVKRPGACVGYCFMVHRRVFDKAGLFDDDMRLGGYEDDEFFRRSRQAGFRLGTTGRSFLHHYGSVTQIAMKASMNKPKASLGDRDYYRRKYKLTWLKRHWWRWQEKSQLARWRQDELAQYGCTLVALRKGGAFIWR